MAVFRDITFLAAGPARERSRSAAEGARMADAVRLIHQAVDCADDGDYEGAVKLLTRAAEADPTNPQAYHERAMALSGLDRDREAVADFERALELNPVFPGARGWLARTLGGLGEHRRAAEEWLRHLRDEPDGPPGMGVCPQTWADCAEQFALAGDSARAIELLEEYVARHAARVTAFACYETAPLRLLAGLLDQVGYEGRAAELRKRARASPHRVPADG
jgi:predicted Zn-dependent protease